ncbi:MAG TPA: glycine cleavage system aminomethyltransferase GcvT [Chitinophagales bacterium]|nr:glycine cleavage system aminomethyltransferase GcvT [Chitinophagales bacterium]
METLTIKQTPLSEVHAKLGAKMVPFAGYNMPVSYSGINDEHHTVRNAVGMFDVSHMGEFILKGEAALDLIQRLTSNDAGKLTPGKAQYSCMPNEHGGIVDDLLVYRLGEKEWMLVVNSSNMQKDWDWIMRHNDDHKVEAHDISDRTALLAVQGPLALKTLQPLTDVDLSTIPYYSFAKGKFAGVDNVLLSNTGYTGAGGFEVYFDNANAETIWNAIMKSGAPHGIKPIGLGARDTLRLEMGFCLYGNDIDDTTTPLEAGLGWITKFTKDFTARSILEKQKAEGVKRKLVGIETIDRGIPRHDYMVEDASGKTIGKVTSGTQSPTLQKAIGMAYVTTENAQVGNEIFIRVRDNAVKAKVVKLPFVAK